MMPEQTITPSDGEATRNPLLLIVEDDLTLNNRLSLAMGGKGYEVANAASIAEASAQIDGALPAFAIVDMRLGDGSGLDFMAELKAKAPECRVIILTGYGNIPTAVSAIGAGAFDFLAKPADADEIHNALHATRHDTVAIPFVPAASDRVRREHIDTVFEQYGRNVSETARRLGMHRRTLQRILAKNIPK